MTLIIVNKHQNYKFIFFVSLFLCLISGFSNLGYEFSFQRTFYFLPFFIIGYLMSVKKCKLVDLKIISKKISIIILCLAIVTCFIIVCGFGIEFKRFLYGSYNYKELEYILIRFISIAVSLIISLSVVCICNKLNNKRILNNIGKNSMFYFIYHVFFILIIRIIINILSLPTIFPFLIIYCIGIIFCLYFLSKYSVFHKLLNPISYILKR